KILRAVRHLIGCSTTYASASSTSVDSGAQVGKETHQIWQPIISIQTGRVGQHPNPSGLDLCALFSNCDLAIRERVSICAPQGWRRLEGDIASHCSQARPPAT